MAVHHGRMANDRCNPVVAAGTGQKLCLRRLYTLKITDNSFLLALMFLPLFFSCTRKLYPATAAVLPPLPLSVINIPVKIYTKPFLEKAEKLAPLQFTSGEWPAYTQSGCDFRYKYRFVRSALKFSCINNHLSVSLTGNYQVAGSKSACLLGKQVSPWINGSCGFNNEALRRVDIALSAVLHFSPGYTLQSRSVVDKVEPVDKCSVTFLNTDITGMVMSTVRSSMKEFAASLDQAIASLNTSSVVRSIETATAQKVPLHDFGFLSIDPASVTTGSINYAADTIAVTAGFTCYTHLTSDSTASHAKRTLPPLTNADLAGGFIVYANAAYDYPFISRLLTKSAKHRSFEISSEHIMIDSITVRGLEGGAVELKAVFSGSKKGILYLTGKPAFDQGRQVISVPDLNFSLHSKNFVLNAGKPFFNKKVLRIIRRLAVIDINTLYSQNKTQLDKALMHRFAGNITSSGYTEQLSLTGLVSGKDSVLFQVRVKGYAGITAN